MNNKFTESELENAYIELFKSIGYAYINGEEIHRQFKSVLLYDDLNNYLSSKYSNLTDNEKKRIISMIDNIPSVPLYEGNRETYKKITEGFDFNRDDASQLSIHIDFIDYDNIDNNNFKVVNQYTVEDVSQRRPDLLVFINGIPVSIFEFKTAIEEDKTVHDAWEQITIRYARDIPSLLKYSFLSVISDGANTRLGTIFSPYKFYYSWNKISDDEKTTNGISSLTTMVKGVFSKERLVHILRDFVFYPDDSKKSEAIVCRYPQYFATVKMLKNLTIHKRPEGDGKGGI